MWKFIVDVVHDFVSSLQPDVGRGFLHVSNVFLLYIMVAHKCHTKTVLLTPSYGLPRSKYDLRIS